MSDRIAVFNRGRIEQVGRRRDLRQPATAFVAGFVGTSNLISGDLACRCSVHRTVHGATRADPLLPAAAEPARRAERRGAPAPCAACSTSVAHRASWSTSTAAASSVVDQNEPRLGRRRGPCRAPRELWPGIATPTSCSRSSRPTNDKGEHMRRGRHAIAAVAVAVARWCSQRAATSGGGSTAERSTRSARAKASSTSRLGRLRRERLERPDRRLGHPFEEQTAARSNVKSATRPTRWCSSCRPASTTACRRRVTRRCGSSPPTRSRRSTPTCVPNYADMSPFLKEKPCNSVDGQMYGMPHGWGANLLMYNTDVVHARPRFVGRGVRRRLAVQGQGHGVRLADLHRRRGAVPDEDPARPRHQEPVRARPGAVRRRRRAAQAAEGSSSASTGATTPRSRPRSTTAASCSARRGRSSPTWPTADGAPVERDPARRRARPAGRTPG